MDVTKKALKDECEAKWQQLQDVEAQLQKIRKHVCAEAEEVALFDIYQAKELQLKVQLKRITTTPADPFPNDPLVLQELLKEELTQSNEQLEQTLSLIRTQHADVVAENKNKKELHEQHLLIKDELTKKLEYLEQNPDQLDEKVLLADSDKKYQTINKHLIDLMKKLAAFVQTHFPPPSAKETTTLKKTSSKGRRQSGGEEEAIQPVHSLQSMLEDLMNKSVQSPHDPYVELDHETHWQPYIQLLLRCGIALRHPDDDTKMRLTPFHY